MCDCVWPASQANESTTRQVFFVPTFHGEFLRTRSTNVLPNEYSLLLVTQVRRKCTLTYRVVARITNNEITMKRSFSFIQFTTLVTKNSILKRKFAAPVMATVEIPREKKSGPVRPVSHWCHCFGKNSNSVAVVIFSYFSFLLWALFFHFQCFQG